MRNRTRVIAAGVVAAAALAGSGAAAVASTSGATPAAPASANQVRTVSAGAKCVPGSNVAARLGVSPDRLDQALRAFKMSHRNTNRDVSQSQFDAAVARNLGVSPSRVRQAFAAGDPGCASKSGGAKAASPQDEQRAQAAMTRVVVQELHVSADRAAAALRPIFAAGHAEINSPTFATAARSLGVSTQQLATALMHAKESLAPGAVSTTASKG